MIQITLGTFHVLMHTGSEPPLLDVYVQYAALVDRIEPAGEADGERLFLAVARDAGWPFLVSIQRYAPGNASGFSPGVLLVPETQRLFVGAGTRLLIYDLDTVQRQWTGATLMGFGCWERQGDTILMSAELELAAFDLHGRRLWSTFVEPPWGYTVEGGNLTLDVMGTVSVFDVLTGPAP